MANEKRKRGGISVMELFGKRPRGRPPTRKWPEQIPDTPENVARACMQGRPKKRWR